MSDEHTGPSTPPTTTGPTKRKPGRPKGSGHKQHIDQLRTDYDTLLARVSSLEAFVKSFFPIGGKISFDPASGAGVPAK